MESIGNILEEEDVPDELKGTTARTTGGEASLKGHLKNEGGGDEGGGSSAYVPEDKSKDKQLIAAVALLEGKPIDAYVTKVKAEAKPADKPKDSSAN